MSKRIACVTCVAVLAVASIACAQVRGGVKAGLNVANQTLTIPESGVSTTFENREALVAGAFLEIPLARRVAIQPEALIDMKGSENSFDEGGVGTNSVLKLTSLTFPVLLRVDLRTAGRLVPYVYAGPTIGFLLSATGNSSSGGRLRDEDVKAQYRTTELGGTLGGGMRSGRLLAEVRYTRGLTNAFAEPLRSIGKGTNRAIAVMGGIRF